MNEVTVLGAGLAGSECAGQLAKRGIKAVSYTHLKISSRKNRIICHMRAVASDPAYRSEVGQFICDGEKTLREAIEYGAEIVQVLWREGAHTDELPPETEQYCAPADLVEYASPLKSGHGPVFTAVSYTHLDVYKRQALYRARPAEERISTSYPLQTRSKSAYPASTGT